MEPENLTVPRQFAEAFGDRDIERMLGLMHPEIEFTARRSAFEGGAYRGHDGMRQWVSELLELAPDYWVNVGEVRAVGDDGFVLIGRQGGTAGEQQVPVEMPLALAGTLRDGLMFRVRAYADGEAALEASGLSD
jgi:ketosteroid isomerase-like protein